MRSEATAWRSEQVIAVFSATCVLAIFLSLITFALAGKVDYMTKFDWLPTESGPTDAPMEIVTAAFTTTDGLTIPIFEGRLVYGGWGVPSSMRDQGPRLKAIPEALDLRYFSLVEDTFYEGRFALDADAMLRRFQEGIPRPPAGEKTTYDRIMVGLGPGGHVSVWVTGAGIVHEVGVFEAAGVDMPWEEFKPETRYERQEYLQVMLTDAFGATGTLRPVDGVLPKRYARYRQQFPWRFEITSAAYATAMWLETFNGERDWFHLLRPAAPRVQRGVPKKVRLEWEDTTGQSYGADIVFDETETLAAFEKMNARKGAEPMLMGIRIADTNAGVSLSLEKGDLVFEFEKAVAKVFRRR